MVEFAGTHAWIVSRLCYLRGDNVSDGEIEARTWQPIRSGDIITIPTAYLGAETLSSKELIDLQWHLDRIASLLDATTDIELVRFSDDDEDDFDRRASPTSRVRWHSPGVYFIVTQSASRG